MRMTGLELHFCPWGKNYGAARSSPRRRHSSVPHLMGSSPYYLPNKKRRLLPPLLIWCGQQDSNLHALAVEPKSTESTNSTMPAYSSVFYSGRYPRRGISPDPRFIKTGEPALNTVTATPLRRVPTTSLPKYSTSHASSASFAYSRCLSTRVLSINGRYSLFPQCCFHRELSISTKWEC